MKIIVLLAAVIAASVAVPHKMHKRPNYDFIDYYSCANKGNGMYTHPSDCTRFIICSNGNAADMACPDCDLNNSQCDGSKYLYWQQQNSTHGICEWPSLSTCTIDGGSGSSSSEEASEPTTAAPPTDDSEEPTDSLSSESAEVPEPTQPPTEESNENGDSTSSSSESHEDPTPPAPNHCKNKKHGQSCKADDCDHCGYCEKMKSYYFWCNRTIPSNPHEEIIGVVVHEECDEETWWNPTVKPDGVTLGGHCDFWVDLPKEIQDRYTADPECIKERVICQYGQDDVDECSEKYWYYDPQVHANFSKRQRLECSTGLIWDQATETCRNRKNVAGC